LKLIVTVDTESDNQWAYEGRITLENLQHLPRFQALCEKHGYVPTYLLACEVLEDRTFVGRLAQWRRSGAAEIGAHLQPWTTPPYTAEEERNRVMQAFPSELPAPLFRRKLQCLTERIADAFGEPPRNFRAARWGLNGTMVAALAEAGYTADCSVTPKISWRDQKGLPGGPGGPDYRCAPVEPFEVASEDVCRTGRSGLLEVPMTIIYTGPLVREKGALASWLSRQPENILKKVLNRLWFRRKWLRVMPDSRVSDWKNICESAARNGLSVLEFMVHSSELAVGGSPLTKTAGEVEFVYHHLEEMFRYLRTRGVSSGTLSQCAREHFQK
jgi:hypothetical protein